jgi:hypothetical protein
VTRLRTGNRRAKRKLWWRQWDLVEPMRTEGGGHELTPAYQYFASPPLPAWAGKAWLRIVHVKNRGHVRNWVVGKRPRWAGGRP